MNSSPVNFRSIDRWAENFGLYDINMTVNKFQLSLVCSSLLFLFLCFVRLTNE